MERKSEMKEENNSMVIGIDNGYGYIKTAQTISLNGVDRLVGPTSLPDNLLEVGDAYYTVGERRMPYVPDKTATPDHYLGTLAAIARELKIQGHTHANVTLAQGLPYQFYDAQRERFRKYMLQNKQLKYKFEQIEYTVKFQDAIIYPQCLPVVCRLSGPGKKVGVDIGSGTVDVVTYLDNRLLRTESFTIPQAGTIYCMEQIRNSFVARYNLQLDEWVIQEFMISGQAPGISKEYMNFIEEIIRNYVQERIVRELGGRGIDPRFMQVVFCGGGAMLIKRYGEYKDSVIYDGDIHANARGYERLTNALLSRKRQ